MTSHYLLKDRFHSKYLGLCYNRHKTDSTAGWSSRLAHHRTYGGARGSNPLSATKQGANIDVLVGGGSTSQMWNVRR